METILIPFNITCAHLAAGLHGRRPLLLLIVAVTAPMALTSVGPQGVVGVTPIVVPIVVNYTRCGVMQMHVVGWPGALHCARASATKHGVSVSSSLIAQPVC